jgi:hypothetical protein
MRLSLVPIRLVKNRRHICRPNKNQSYAMHNWFSPIIDWALVVGVRIIKLPTKSATCSVMHLKGLCHQFRISLKWFHGIGQG